MSMLAVNQPASATSIVAAWQGKTGQENPEPLAAKDHSPPGKESPPPLQKARRKEATSNEQKAPSKKPDSSSKVEPNAESKADGTTSVVNYQNPDADPTSAKPRSQNGPKEPPADVPELMPASAVLSTAIVHQTIATQQKGAFAVPVPIPVSTEGAKAVDAIIASNAEQAVAPAFDDPTIGKSHGIFGDKGPISRFEEKPKPWIFDEKPKPAPYCEMPKVPDPTGSKSSDRGAKPRLDEDETSAASNGPKPIPMGGQGPRHAMATSNGSTRILIDAIETSGASENNEAAAELLAPTAIGQKDATSAKPIQGPPADLAADEIEVPLPIDGSIKIIARNGASVSSYAADVVAPSDGTKTEFSSENSRINPQTEAESEKPRGTGEKQKPANDVAPKFDVAKPSQLEGQKLEKQTNGDPIGITGNSVTGSNDPASKGDTGSQSGDRTKSKEELRIEKSKFSLAEQSDDSNNWTKLQARPMDATSAKTEAHTKSDSTTTLEIGDARKVLSQVADRIEMLAAVRPRNGVSIRLDPDHLGSITLRIFGDAKQVEAEINASNPDVRDALHNHRNELALALDSRGIHIQAINVGADSLLADTNHQKGQSQNEQQAQKTNSGFQNEATTNRAPTLETARKQLRSADGVDVWI